MDIKPIRTKKDHEAALKAIEKLMAAKRNTPEGDRLDVLVTLVQAYEARHFPLDAPDPVAAIEEDALETQAPVRPRSRRSPALGRRPGDRSPGA